MVVRSNDEPFAKATYMVRSFLKSILLSIGYELQRVPPNNRTSNVARAHMTFSQSGSPPKAYGEDWRGRFREIISDPVNFLIERHPMAGIVANGFVMLHNGNIVPANGDMRYYGPFNDILIINRGVHEPVEEYAFQEMIKQLPNNPKMLELGAYWSHYSMWLKRRRPDACTFMVEPDFHNLRVGQNNFAINDLTGHFIHEHVSKGRFEVDKFMREKGIAHLNVLLCDIQGFEMEMIDCARETFSNKLIDYVFVSTHSANLHAGVEKSLRSYDYDIAVSSNFDFETTSSDGIIVGVKSGLSIFGTEMRALGRVSIAHAAPRLLIKSVYDRLH